MFSKREWNMRSIASIIALLTGTIIILYIHNFALYAKIYISRANLTWKNTC